MDKWFYRASVALVVIGLAVSIYMTIYKETGNDNMCLGSGDCSTVVHSRYSEVNDFLTVPEFGILGFLALLGLLAFESRSNFLQTNGSTLFFGIALIGFLFTLWLIYIEVVLIKAFCPFCLTTQSSMILIFILSIVRLKRQPQID
ncbi:MAG: vitamin K epoxide reductase family protein [Anaerolineales bacterium]|nr:vitamin K epoxide reductase family protein [Anaerolineales bacterium]